MSDEDEGEGVVKDPNFPRLVQRFGQRHRLVEQDVGFRDRIVLRNGGGLGNESNRPSEKGERGDRGSPVYRFTIAAGSLSLLAK